MAYFPYTSQLIDEPVGNNPKNGGADVVRIKDALAHLRRQRQAAHAKLRLMNSETYLLIARKCSKAKN